MERKTKNIIAITITIILVIGMGLTIHFAKVNGRDDFSISKNGQIRDVIQNDSMRDREKPNIQKNEDDTTNQNNDSIAEEKKSTSENDQILDKKSTRGNRPGNMPSFDKDDFRNIDTISIPNKEDGMTTKYVVLLSIESFLLGGSVMYLVMNNVGSNKEKKSKK